MSAPTLSKEDYETRKSLAEELKTLAKEEYEEVFRIIKRAGVAYSENSNGVHFDLTAVHTECVEQISKFLELCKTQRMEQEARSKELEGLRHEVKDDASTTTSTAPQV
jgi:hypothetical protein